MGLGVPRYTQLAKVVKGGSKMRGHIVVPILKD